jgi:predicted DNA binding protein
MRYLTCVIRPVEKVHPVEAAIAAAPAVTPVAIHQTKLLDDGTCVTLLEVKGDLASLESLLADHGSVLEFTVAGDREGFVYLQSEPDDLTRSMIRLQSESAVVVRFPVEHTGDGGLRATMIGDDAGFRRGFEAFPDELDVEVEAIGDYRPDVRDVFAGLTDRQQEILATAIRAGYYEDPRRASQADVAEAIGVAPGTVSEHLRRIEATVFSEYVIGSDGGDAPVDR